jgi:transcription antitermination factor NusG
VCRVKRRWSDRTKIIDEPLFPGYLFGRFHLNDRVRVLQAQGVKQILGIGNTPAPISEGELANLKMLVAANPVMVPWPYLRAGQRVHIDRGPLADRGIGGFAPALGGYRNRPRLHRRSGVTRASGRTWGYTGPR